MQNNVAIDKNSREYQENLFNSGRTNLLLVLVFTVVNIAVMLAGSDSYWLFSASIPYYFAVFGVVFDNGVIGTYTMTALGIAAAILVVYLLSWIFSKKKSGWLVVALVFFVLDTVCMMLLILLLQVSLLECLVDVLFHVWVVVSLFRACLASHKLKTMPETAAQPEIWQPTGPDLD